MTLKLWEVDLSMSAYVVAESKDEAERIAERYARDELDNGVACHAMEIEDGGFVEPEWLGSIPYGAADGQTVQQWLDAHGLTVNRIRSRR